MDHDKRKKLSLANTIKNIGLVAIIFGLIFFQFQWFAATSNVEIQYDFTKYTDAEFERPDLTDYFNTLIEFVAENSINITESAESAFNNITLRGDIEDQLGQTLTQVQQVYEAYLNGSLPDLIYDFFREMWNDVLKSFIPEEYLEPTYITISKDGWSTIEDIFASLNVILNDQSSPILEEVGKSLSYIAPLILEVSLASIIRNLISLAYDLLVDLTVTILEETNSTISESFIDYLFYLILDNELSISLNFNGLFGLLPIDFKLALKIDPIIRRIAEGFGLQ